MFDLWVSKTLLLSSPGTPCLQTKTLQTKNTCAFCKVTCRKANRKQTHVVGFVDSRCRCVYIWWLCKQMVRSKVFCKQQLRLNYLDFVLFTYYFERLLSVWRSDCGILFHPNSSLGGIFFNQMYLPITPTFPLIITYCVIMIKFLPSNCIKCVWILSYFLIVLAWLWKKYHGDIPLFSSYIKEILLSWLYKKNQRNFCKRILFIKK